MHPFPSAHVFLIAALCLTTLWGISSRAAACSCMTASDARVGLAHSAAVFEGRVLRITRRKIGGFMQQEVRLSVLRDWKGTRGHKTVQVITPDRDESCGFGFAKNKSYLVYAESDEGTLTTSSCSRTRLLSDAAEDLHALADPTYMPQAQVFESPDDSDALAQVVDEANEAEPLPPDAEPVVPREPAASIDVALASEQTPKTPAPPLKKSRSGGCATGAPARSSMSGAVLSGFAAALFTRRTRAASAHRPRVGG